MSFKCNSLYYVDGYKLSHKAMLAPGTTKLYGTWIPRSTKHAPKGITKIVSFGQQLVWKWLHDEFEENFFFTKDKKNNVPLEILKNKALQFVKDMSLYLGMEYDGKHFEELWDLGYLPIKVKALPEGIETNPNIPHMTFVNTVDGFAWLTLYLETIVSSLAWKPSTAATIAKLYRRQAEEWVKKTDIANLGLVDFMCHDFSARGLDPMSQYLIGLGHATSFKGSDTLPVISASRYFYGVGENEMPINSVNASEHSVSTTKIFTVGEQQMIADWLKIFDKGILSIVADTFDLWKLITEYLPANKEAIMARDGKLVIRPDSGDPVDIICGIDNNNVTGVREKCTYDEYVKVMEKPVSLNEFKGVIELLWDIFGGTINKGKELLSDDEYQDKFLKLIDSDLPDFIEEGMFDEVQSGGVRSWVVRYDKYENNSSYVSKVRNWLEENYPNTFPKVERYKVLDPHIGAIYGDSITPERQKQIYERLAAKGFAATNIVLGVGSFTYQYNTRDTLGFAAKGAWFEVEELTGNMIGNPSYPETVKKSYNIYKDPITDDGTKKSLKGFQFVYQDKDGEYITESEVSEKKAFSEENLLKTIYKDGKFYNQTTLEEIRERLNN